MSNNKDMYKSDKFSTKKVFSLCLLALLGSILSLINSSNAREINGNVGATTNTAGQNSNSKTSNTLNTKTSVESKNNMMNRPGTSSQDNTRNYNKNSNNKRWGSTGSYSPTTTSPNGDKRNGSYLPSTSTSPNGGDASGSYTTTP